MSTRLIPRIPGLSVHRVVAHAPIRVGDELWVRVNDPVRHATMRNHTATHLLHAALRKVLGPAREAGGQRRCARPVAF